MKFDGKIFWYWTIYFDHFSPKCTIHRAFTFHESIFFANSYNIYTFLVYGSDVYISNVFNSFWFDKHYKEKEKNWEKMRKMKEEDEKIETKWVKKNVQTFTILK